MSDIIDITGTKCIPFPEPTRTWHFRFSREGGGGLGRCSGDVHSILSLVHHELAFWPDTKIEIWTEEQS